MKKLLIFILLFTVSCISVDETKNNDFDKNKKSTDNFNTEKKKNKNNKKDITNISKNENINLNNLECSQRNEVVEYALSFDKLSSVPKPGVNDCSGFVKFVFAHFNVDIFNISTDSDSGTEIIYNYSKENGKVFTENKTPKKGDFIFFDNSYDRNKDGKVNDKFTHIAIVTNTDSDGTVEYIHKSGSGINIQYMNLKDKENQYSEDKKRINSYLRKKTKNDFNNTPYLSGQMFKSYGTIFSDNCKSSNDEKDASVTTGFNPSKEKDSNDDKDAFITTGFNPSKEEKHTKDESSTKNKNNFSFRDKNTVEIDKDSNDEKDALITTGFNPSKKKDSNNDKDASVTTGFNPSKKKDSNDDKDGFNPSKDKREKIVEFAKKTKPNDLTKNKFKNNSSGFIAYVYKKILNIDVLNDKNIAKKNKKGQDLNGVEIINNYINKYGIIYRNTDIQNGDLVFFDNTFEENRNGKITNYTLIGIVIDVDNDETVTFLYNSEGKIQTGKLNKKFPKQQFSTKDKKEINSFLRKKAKNDKKGTKYLSGEFYRSFGTVFKKN